MHGFKKLLKKILLVLTSCVVLLASVLIINTLRFASKQTQVEPIHPVSVDENNVALRLAHALRFQTVSQDIRGEEFLAREHQRRHLLSVEVKVRWNASLRYQAAA